MDFYEKQKHDNMEKTISAEELAKELRAISVAEFFEKNRHLLGYENPTKALLTVVKECVDNSIDACEESGILPEIKVSVKQLTPDRFKITVMDNGPGILDSKVPFAFGKLLYGSKFHRLRQARGTQGIGVSGAILYSQLTTGKPVKISSSTGKKIHNFELLIDVIKNEPHIISHEKENNPNGWHGIKIAMNVEGRYVGKSRSIPAYLKQTAIMNPYAKIIYKGPDEKISFARGVKKLPRRPKEIKPHPYGIELGILGKMVRATRAKNIEKFLRYDFSRVGKTSAKQICKLAKIKTSAKPHQLNHDEIEKLFRAMQTVKLVSPPTDCLSISGKDLIIKGLKKEVEGEYFVAISRSPTVYRGMPFAVECGLAYGGNLNPNRTSKLFRFANKVPLLYHQSDCAITKAVTGIDWRRYGLQQSSGSLPVGPLAILVHLVSVWVPFTSEGKQAIASYPNIIREVKLALQDAGRDLKRYISKRKRIHELHMRQNLFEKYIPEVADSLSKISETSKEKIEKGLEKMLKSNKIEENDENAKEED